MNYNWDDPAELRAQIASGRKSPATTLAYTPKYVKFQKWLDGREPADHLLAQFLHGLFEKGLAPSTIKQYRAAIVYYCKSKNNVSPAGEMTKGILERISREGANRGRGACRGLQEEEFKAMVAVCEDHTLAGIRDKAMFGVMWDSALRVSEAAALTFEDIEIDEKDRDATVRIRRSKTDQTGAGESGYASVQTVGWIKFWARVTNITSGPLFRPVKNGSLVLNRHMGRSAISWIVDKRAKQAGLKGISTHSFRRGMVEHLTRLGVPTHEVMLVTRHKSATMVTHYSMGIRAKENAVAKYVYGKRMRRRAGPRATRRLTGATGFQVIQGGKAS